MKRRQSIQTFLIHAFAAGLILSHLRPVFDRLSGDASWFAREVAGIVMCAMIFVLVELVAWLLSWPLSWLADFRIIRKHKDPSA